MMMGMISNGILRTKGVISSILQRTASSSSSKSSLCISLIHQINSSVVAGCSSKQGVCLIPPSTAYHYYGSYHAIRWNTTVVAAINNTCYINTSNKVNHPSKQTQNQYFSSNTRNTNKKSKKNVTSNKSRQKQNQQQQQKPLINEYLVSTLIQNYKKEHDHHEHQTNIADLIQIRLVIDTTSYSTHSNNNINENNNDAKNDDDQSDHEDNNDDQLNNNDDDDAHESDNNDDDTINDKNQKTKDNNNKSQVMSLTQAISTCGSLSLDLIAINLSQDIPVLKAANYEKLMYYQSKKSSSSSSSTNNTSSSSSSSSSSLTTKEFSFRAGIAPFDLERKVSNMISYLQKGHACQVTISTNQRQLRLDPQAIQTTLERVFEFVGDEGKIQGNNMKFMPNGRSARMLFQPNSKK